MSDEATQAGADASAPAAPADAGAQQHQEEQRQDEPLRNYREVVELRKDVREVQRMLRDTIVPALQQTKPQPPKQAQAQERPATAPDGVQAQYADRSELVALERKLELREAFLEHKIADPEVRELIEAAATARQPTDVRDFVEKYAKKLAPAVPAAEPVRTEAARSAPPQSAPQSDTGAPAGQPKVKPQDLYSVDVAAFRAMTRSDRKQLLNSHNASTGGGQNQNPFAQAKALASAK